MRSGAAKMKDNEFRIRRARAGDEARLAELSGQLGYPVEAKEMKRRLRGVVSWNRCAAFVAETRKRDVIGWVQVSVTPVLETDLRAEVNGLVVAEGQRTLGAGWKLLEMAEIWARKHGCKSMSVRSNVIRERAHLFYLRHGYEHYKTQKAFRKPL
jgi:GNAT superfamily N-acetyltransferase